MRKPETCEVPEPSFHQKGVSLSYWDTRVEGHTWLVPVTGSVWLKPSLPRSLTSASAFSKAAVPTAGGPPAVLLTLLISDFPTAPKSQSLVCRMT